MRQNPSVLRSPSVSDQKRKLLPKRLPSTASALASGNTQANGASEAISRAPSVSNTADVNELVQQARLAVLAQFKDEAEKARELGRQRGLQEGRQAGAEEIKKEFAAALARVRSLADKLQQENASKLGPVEDIAVAIAFEAICKVLGENTVTREGIQALVRQAAARLHSTQCITIRLHPADLSLLRDAGALDTPLPSGAEVAWVADKAIALGGCVVESDADELDARLETQIEELKSTLLAARNR